MPRLINTYKDLAHAARSDCKEILDADLIDDDASLEERYEIYKEFVAELYTGFDYFLYNRDVKLLGHKE